MKRILIWMCLLFLVTFGVSAVSSPYGKYVVTSANGYEGELDISQEYIGDGKTRICLEEPKDARNEVKQFVKNLDKMRIRSGESSQKIKKVSNITKEKINKREDKITKENKITRYCYEADPIIEKWIKFGKNSIVMELQSDLISYWKSDTDGSYPDAHGSHDGTINGASYKSSGKINGSYEFDGDNDYIKINYNDQIDRDFSVSLWFKSVSSNAYQAVISQSRDTGSNNGWLVGFKGTTGKFGITEPTESEIIYSPLEYDDYNWHHGVVTVSGGTTATFTIYVDGTQVAQTTSSKGQAEGLLEYDLIIGADQEGSAGYWDGKIDEVGIWNTNLSSDLVQILYSDGNGNQYPFHAGVNLEVIDQYQLGSEYIINTSLTSENSILNQANFTVDGVLYNQFNYSNISTKNQVFNYTGTTNTQHNWTISVSDNDGNTNTTNGTLLIETTQLEINISPQSIVTYPTETTVEGFGCSPSDNCTLYRNGEIITNPDIEILTDGTYEYVYNSSKEVYLDANATLEVTSSSGTGSTTVIFNQTANTTMTYNQCPNTSQGVSILVLMVIIGFGMMILGYFMSPWAGIIGALMIMVTSWTLTGCQQTLGYLFAVFGIYMVAYFLFKR